MKKVFVGVLFATLALYGCSSDDGGDGGNGGGAGTGGSAGTGGMGGSAGVGGMGGSAGVGGMGGSAGVGGMGGSAGVGGMGGEPADVVYEQNFNSFVLAPQEQPTSLADDGWLVFGAVFNADGSFQFQYGPFPAPNGGPGFSAIVDDQGGPGQGPRQLSIYNDYNCCQPNDGHFPVGTGTDLVEASVFQEPYPNLPGEQIPAAIIGQTFTFSFDAKRGNINSPTDESGKCDPTSPNYTTNPPCDSTALAYIQTLQPPSFDRTNFVEIDMTDLPVEWGRYEISLDLTDPALEGQVLQFGFRTVANGFEPSGNFYDNVVATLSPSAP